MVRKFEKTGPNTKVYENDLVKISVHSYECDQAGNRRFWVEGFFKGRLQVHLVKDNFLTEVDACGYGLYWAIEETNKLATSLRASLDSMREIRRTTIPKMSSSALKGIVAEQEIEAKR